jgi:hypothetical protein
MTDRPPREHEGCPAEERYWRIRVGLEFVRFALAIFTEHFWEILRRH